MTAQIIPGALRETKNPLLLHSAIGKPQLRGFALPPEEFTYGITSTGKNYGTADAFCWQTNVPKVRDQKPAQRDFISINKAATQAGLVTAKEHFQYRTTHDIKKSRRITVKSARPLRQPLPSTVYGIPTVQSSLGFDILEHKYSEDWLDATQKNSALQRLNKGDQNKLTHKSYSETCASILRRYSPKVDPPPLWQMPRFQKKALPVLQTFRTEEERERAIQHHNTDSTARSGSFGQGIYREAKS